MKGHYFRSVRFWRTAVFTMFLAMSLSTLFAMSANAQTQINLGDRVTGTIRVPTDEDEYTFPALNGTLASFDLRPTKGSTFQPTNVRLLDPDGIEIALPAPDAKNRLKVKKLPLPKDGVYSLIIAGAAGDYQLKTKGKFPKQKGKLAGVVNQGGDDKTPFGGMPNAIVKIKLQLEKGSTLDIRAEILTPTGPPIQLANPDAKGKIKDQKTLNEVGQHQIRVFGANNSQGAYKGKFSVKFAKSKQKLVEQDDNETTPPNISIDKPADGSTINTNTPLVQVSYNDAQSGINIHSFTATINGIDRSNDFTVTPTEATLQIATPLPEGNNTIVASIADNAGNTAQATSTFEVFTFSGSVLPLFTQNDVWFPGSLACNAPGCHTGVGGAHDLDMGTYQGIIAGADAGTEAIVFPGRAEESPLRKRMRDNRMPWNISTTVPRNGPNDEVLLVEDWIDAGAPNGAFTDRNGDPKDFNTDVLPLFTQNDVWFQGSLACNASGCHTGIGSAHDLDMGTYAGIIAGSDGGTEPIVFRGDAENSPLRERLRNNRMPWGISTSVPRNGPNDEVLIIEKWINSGALNDNPPETVSFQNDVLPLFTQNDVWFPGSLACNAPGCHTGVGGAHDLDMGTYAGIIAGSDAGTEPIVFPGDAENSPLRKRMRNNRMPWNIPTTVPRNGPNGEVLLIEDWINAGAPNGAFTDRNGDPKDFNADILPLFTQNDVWFPGSLACNAVGCHTGIGGAHDLDMGTYAGIIAGADGGTEPIVFPGRAEESPLRKRLRNNRMPWNIDTSVPRNGPNNEVLTIETWINEGAKNN